MRDVTVSASVNYFDRYIASTYKADRDDPNVEKCFWKIIRPHPRSWRGGRREFIQRVSLNLASKICVALLPISVTLVDAGLENIRLQGTVDEGITL